MSFGWGKCEGQSLSVDGVALECASWGSLPDKAPTIILLHEGLGSVAMCFALHAACNRLDAALRQRQIGHIPPVNMQKHHNLSVLQAFWENLSTLPNFPTLRAKE